jgi:tetratricopeptide (TPR) repeat protein
LERAVAVADASWGKSSAGYVRQDLARAYKALDRPVPKRARVAADAEDDCSCDSGPIPEIEALRQEIEALRQNGRIERATELARERVHSAEAEHGAVSRTAADAWGDLGLLLWQTDPAGAADAYERELEILRRMDDASASEVARAARSAANLAASLAQHERCEALRRVQVEALRAGSASASLADAMTDLGETHMQLERYAEATADFRRAAELWTTVAGDGSSEVIKVRGRMAWSMIRQSRFGEAEEVLVADLARLENARSEEDLWALERVLYALAEVFQETGRDVDAQTMRERRLALMSEM